MITIFKDKIKTEMSWSDDQYYIFFDRYIEFLSKYRSDQPSVLYTEDYISAVLNLYFYVYRHRIVNKKSFLLALLLNGLPHDKYNLHPNIYQSLFLKEFFESEIISFISEQDREFCSFFCEANYQEPEFVDYSDLYFDYLLFNDFRTVFKAVLLDESKGLVIYHFNPAKIIFKVSPDSKFESSEFIYSMECNLEKISNLNMKDLYKEKIETFKIFLDKKKSNE